LRLQVHVIPEAPGVRLVGAGYQGDDHYGLKEVDFRTSTIINTQADPPSQEDIDNGFTRFGRWHIDCVMYDMERPMVTALRCLKLPQGPEQTIRWDDGSNTEMKTKPGTTAFYSCQQLYASLSPEQRAIADNSRVQYAPHPFQ
jgi:alpha-ketoglutarate-dependent taurine dioxygenase